MAFQLSEEQFEFHQTIRKASEEKGPSGLWTCLKELGVFEYIITAETDPFRELSLVALEAGRILATESIVENLFFGPYLFRKLGTEYPLLSNQQLISSGQVIVVGNFGDETAPIFGLPQSRHALLLDGCTVKIFGESNPPSFTEFKSLDRSVSMGILDASETSRLVKLPENVLSLHLSYLLLKSFEIVGATTFAFELTREYVQTRKQFGVIIGSFQAVQHQLADAYLKLEMMRSLTEFAGWAVAGQQVQAAFATAAALRHCVEVAPEIAETAIQLHGGIGFTWEYNLHHALRRIRQLCRLIDLRRSILDDLLLKEGISQQNVSVF